MELRTPGEIDAMAEAGQVVAKVLAATRQAAVEQLDAGVTGKDLDAVAAQVLSDNGADSCYVGYHPAWAPSPYPAVLCVSVNDVVVHAIPDDKQLQPGDVVSVDFACSKDGWCADAALTFVLGPTPDPAVLTMIDTAERSLSAGIAEMRRGNQLGDVSHAIGATARADGYGLLADHGGHGIGREMHGSPFVENEGRAHRGPKLKSGLVLCLEPMLQLGGRDDYRHTADGWGVATADGSVACHVEHTVAITDDGPRVLTSL